MSETLTDLLAALLADESRRVVLELDAGNGLVGLALTFGLLHLAIVVHTTVLRGRVPRQVILIFWAFAVLIAASGATFGLSSFAAHYPTLHHFRLVAWARIAIGLLFVVFLTVAHRTIALHRNALIEVALVHLRALRRD